MAGNLKDFVLVNHDGEEVFIHGVVEFVNLLSPV